MPISKLIFLVALLAAVPAFAAEHVAVDQLSREIASFGKEKDAKVADRLDDLQLTQRLSIKNMTALEARLPGHKSRRALIMLADQAEFLDLPAAEIPSRPAPDLEQQRAIMTKAVEYIQAAIRRLPNLYADRQSIRYEDTPILNRNHKKGDYLVRGLPMHFVDKSVARVLYREGREIIQNKAAGWNGLFPAIPAGVGTNGEFGPIFSVFYEELQRGDLAWNHWENGPSGLEAVFRFKVPKAASKYEVTFCCVDLQSFRSYPAYHGELTVDPSSGTILRVTVIADMARHVARSIFVQSEVSLSYAVQQMESQGPTDSSNGLRTSVITVRVRQVCHYKPC